MEAVEAFLDGEWDSLNKLFSYEDSDLLLHCNGTNFFSYDGESPSNLYCGTVLHSNINNLAANDSGFTTTCDESMGRASMFHDDLMEEILQLKAQISYNTQSENWPKQSDDSCKEMHLEMMNHEDHVSSRSSKKRPRVAREVCKSCFF